MREPRRRTVSRLGETGEAARARGVGEEGTAKEKADKVGLVGGERLTEAAVGCKSLADSIAALMLSLFFA